MSRRSLEVEFTLEPRVWSHSGVCNLDSLRSLEVGVIPESVVTPEFVVWSYSGVWSPRVTPEAIVWSLQPFRVCNLEAANSTLQPPE